jgi:hypothetical protein
MRFVVMEMAVCLRSLILPILSNFLVKEFAATSEGYQRIK